MPTFDQSTICDSKIREALKTSKKLDSLINKGKSQHLGVLKSQMNKMNENALSPLEDVSSSIDDLTNSINNSADDLAERGMDSVEVDDMVTNIVDCLGIDSGSSDSMSLPDIPDGNPAKMILDIANSAFDSAMGMLDGAVEPFEKAVGEALSELENLIPSDMIDMLLDSIECLSGCPGADQLPSQLDIENKMNSIGLNINSNVDFNSSGFSGMDSISSEVKTQSLNIKDKVNDTKSATKNLFDKSPF